MVSRCREAGRITADESWQPWSKEFDLDAGRIDVLLTSSHGQPAIIETKLSYNPQKRREVVAQVLDYAVSLQEVPRSELPKLPVSDLAPDPADLDDCLAKGRFLLTVAGDMLDPRALRLSQALLAGHLTSEWDLAMVDMNVYRSVAAQEQLLIVPELRGVLLAEVRQVVRVQVEAQTPQARILVEHLRAEDPSTALRPKLASVDDFVARVTQIAPTAGAVVGRIVERFQQVETASDGRWVLGLQTATANLYWKSDAGALRRIFTLSQKGRFRIWLIFVLKDGRKDIAELIRELAKPIVTIAPDEGSGAVFIGQTNVNTILAVVDTITKAVVQKEP